MYRFSVPIIVWVVAGLVLVAILPLVAAWFQIDRNIGSIIEQTQLTHQIVASSTAERLNSRIELLEGLLDAAGSDPDIYLEPGSEAAGQAVVDVFGRMEGALALTLYFRRDGRDEVVYAARRTGSPGPDQRLVAPEFDAVPDILLIDGRHVLRLQRETARPRLFLHALVEFDMDIMRPGVLTEASELLLVDRTGRVLLGRENAFELLPEEVRLAMALEGVTGANKSLRHADMPVVSGFSRVGDLPLNVVSLQPAVRAEVARVEMHRTALITFAGIAAAVLLLSAGAWVVVVRPIRQIVSAQRELTGGEQQGPGSEINQLRDSFERLEQAIRDRDQLSEVFLGRYQVLKRLGSGAMGTVYLGWDPKLQRKVALKTIKFSDRVLESERRELTSRLLREGVSAARLTHPNVVTVYDVLGDERGAFLAMEYIDGPSLDERIKDDGALAPELVRRVAEGVLRGLAAAHGQHVIHRDMKPGNVLLASDGTVKVTDFGIAAFLHEARENARVIMGTPGYLAPEAYRTGTFDVRTDLFAVGVLLAECLIGDDVFPGRNTAQIIARTQAREVVFPEPVRVRMARPLTELLAALLAKQPEERPASAEDALAILGVELEAVDIRLDATPRPSRLGRRSREETDQGAATARIQLDGDAGGDR